MLPTRLGETVIIASADSLLNKNGFKAEHPNHPNPDLQHVYSRKTKAGHNEFIILNTYTGKWEYQPKPGASHLTKSFPNLEQAIKYANKDV